MTIRKQSTPAAATAVTPSSSGQQALGATILTAALVLPGIQAAHADSPPENAVLSLKYLDYRDNQPGLNRITSHSPAISIMTPVAGEWAIEGTLTSDNVSGASPRYHTAVSGASRMNDQRTGADFSVTRYFPRGSLTMGAAYSTEHDYESRALSVQGNLSSEDKNTTWSVGIGGARDRINPVNFIVTDEQKRTNNFLLGVTQVFTSQDIGQLTVTRSLGDGYFSDPYKEVDNRPRVRNQTALLAQWNHHYSGSDGTSRLSYRYYTDSYKIRAHTFSAEYVQPLAQGWTVAPVIRLYTQSAASFYFDPVYDTQLGAPFPPGYVFGSNQYVSADQRLSGFGAVTLGLKLIKQLTRDWAVDLKLESYQQRGSWRLFHQGSPGLEPLRAQSIQLGVTRQW
ncbi:DUF3570 domain-containing protein [Undibacterium terreum]|uniref:DUF3570 domain-containing protein n=1 Tax=Undibacterium terreum TaxID=1224302 RepID=A0A916V0X6_9BURK|nr:DUF3570 domain-containing protein [Undibacterium terreum]GGD00416.1 hypothetical protein GCM10011396_54950 [Undibacterium terreum]